MLLSSGSDLCDCLASAASKGSPILVLLTCSDKGMQCSITCHRNRASRQQEWEHVSLTWNVSGVVWHEATPVGVKDVGWVWTLTWSFQHHGCLEGGLQSLALSEVILQCIACDDRIGLADVFLSLGDEPRVARHEIFLRMSIRHKEWRNGVLLGVGREVWLGSGRYRLERCVQWLWGGGVLVVALPSPHVCHFGLMLLLVVFK